MKRWGRTEEISVLIRRLKSYWIHLQASAFQLRDREKGRYTGQAVPAALVPRRGAEGQADLQEYGDRAEQAARDQEDQAGDGAGEDQRGRDDRGDGPHQAGLQNPNAHLEENEWARLQVIHR